MARPVFLVEGMGDVGGDVLYGERSGTRLRAMAGPNPQPSTVVVRDIGQSVKDFIAGKRITVGFVGTPRPAGLFDEPFDDDDPSTWPSPWVDANDFTGGGATVDASVSGGMGRWAFAWNDAATSGGFSISTKGFSRAVPDDVVGAVEWTYTSIFSMPEPGNYIYERLDQSFGLYGCRIEVKDITGFGPGPYYDVQLFTPTSFPSSLTNFVWTSDPMYLEITHNEAGDVELRIWPVADTRPVSPLLTASGQTSALDRSPIYYEASMGSGGISSGQGLAGTGETTVDDIRLDFEIVDSPALDTHVNPDPFTRSVDPGIDGSPTFPYVWDGRDTSFDDLASTLFKVDGSRVFMPGGFEFDSYTIGWKQPPKKHGRASFDFTVPVLVADDGYFPSIILRLGWPGSTAGVSLAVEGDGDFGTVSDPHYRVGSAEGDGLDWVAGRYASVAIEPGNTYTAKMEYDVVKLTAKYKLWKTGDTEPDWQVECPINNFTDHDDCWIDFWDTSSEGDSYFDNLCMPAQDDGDDVAAPPATDVVLWAGYLLKASRQFFFDVDKPDTVSRRWVLSCVDVGTLFQKRVVFKQSDGAHVTGPLYKTPTYDDDVITELITNWLDLSTDDLDLTTLVSRVAQVNPSVTCAAGQAFYPFNGGQTWGDAMETISQVPAAVYALVPGAMLGTSPFARLVYADVDGEDAPVVLSDVRTAPGTFFVDDMNRSTVSPAIGNGWAVNASATGTPTVSCNGSIMRTSPLGTYQRAGFSRNIDALRPGYALLDFYVPAIVDQNTQMLSITLDGLRQHPASIILQAFPLGGSGVWIASQATTFGDGNSMGGGSGIGFTPTASAWHRVKVTFGTDTLSIFVWRIGDPEPVSPTYGPASLSSLASFGQPGVTLSTMCGPGSTAPLDIDNFVLSTDAEELAGRAGYRECTIYNDAGELVNEEFGWGAGKGSDHMVFSHLTDSDSVAEHGLWQRGDTLFNVWCQDTIEAITNAVIYGSPGSRRGHKDDVLGVQLITFDPSLRIGHKVRFINSDYGVDKVLPIRATELTFPSANVVKQEMLLSEALDRWGFEDPAPPFRAYGGGGNGGGGPAPEPTPIFSVDCVGGLLPPEDLPEGWGPGWIGSDTARAGSSPFDDPTSPVSLPARSTSGGVIQWGWNNIVSPAFPDWISSGSRSDFDKGSTGEFDHIFAQYYVASLSDETGDIEDAVVSSVGDALTTGAGSWALMLGTDFTNPRGSGGYGLKIFNWTGTAFENVISHILEWYDNDEDAIGKPVTQGPGSMIDVGPVGGIGYSGGSVSAPVDFNTVAGTLTIEGDPTQATITFHNDADATEVTVTIPAGMTPFSYTDQIRLFITGGEDGFFNGASINVRTFLRFYQGLITRTVLKLWNDDEPPDGMICGPVYTSDFTPLPAPTGLSERETPTKLSDTGYCTAYAWQPGSLRVWLNSLVQRPGIDYTESGIFSNRFDFTSPVDPTERVEARYVTL